MASVPVTLDGVLYDLQNKTTQRVVFIGDASLSGLGVGGGPVIPPPSGGQPPSVWPNPPEGIAPHPEHPIAPGGPPPGIWPNPPEGIAPHPEHPIVIPPDKPPDPVQPPIEWKAIWHPEEGWMVVGIPNVPHPTPS